MSGLTPRHCEAQVPTGLQNVAGVTDGWVGPAHDVPAHGRIFLSKSAGSGGKQCPEGAQCQAWQHQNPPCVEDTLLFTGSLAASQRDQTAYVKGCAVPGT